jgi:hypothetical protein
MSFSLALVAAALLGTTSVAQAGSTAYTAVPPVQIATCATTPIMSSYTIEDTPIWEATGTTLNLHFRNNTPSPISSVTFNVSGFNGSGSSQIVDAGNFSTGVSIKQSFDSPIPDTANVSCSVAKVTFTDGSTWLPAGTTASLSQ